MKSKSVISSLIAISLTFVLALAVPVAFAKGGGSGGGSRGGGSGRSHQFHGPRVQHRFHPHRHHNHFFFSFGVGAFAPGWWYDPYDYRWGPPPSYPYYGYPYPGYYDYPGYWSDPCLSPDPAYTPYCPPTADNPYYQGYSVSPVDHPAPAPPASPESGYESQPPTDLQQPTPPVND